MFAAFLMIFVAFCVTLFVLSLIGDALDRTTRSHRNRYHYVPEQHRRVARAGFKSRMGVR